MLGEATPSFGLLQFHNRNHCAGVTWPLRGPRYNPQAVAITNETGGALQARLRNIGWRRYMRLMHAKYPNGVNEEPQGYAGNPRSQGDQCIIPVIEDGSHNRCMYREPESLAARTIESRCVTYQPSYGKRQPRIALVLFRAYRSPGKSDANGRQLKVIAVENMNLPCSDCASHCV